MPELPEVQTLADDLKREIVGQKIKSVLVLWSGHLKSHSPGDFKREIAGAKIKDVTRRAKNVLIHLDKNRVLLIHPKMTGNLLLGRLSDFKKNKHAHLIFILNGPKALAFSDIRKFGKVVLGNKDKIIASLSIGPEPLDEYFNFTKFKGIVSGKKRSIKTVLMDQRNIAGIGNIYSDEILWLAKINPLRLASRLSGAELKRVYSHIKPLLRKAIKFRGTSISDFKDTAGVPGEYKKFLKVYGRAGEKCSRCGSLIIKVKINGRSGHYCPGCQHKP
jgi:formamidopyrimidine-DNA glycosylase